MIVSSLKEIQGQPKAVRYLSHYAEKPDTIPPLLLFEGPEGTGKYTSAKRFIRQILCFTGNGCGVCPSCKSFDHDTHPDFIQFPEDKTISIGNADKPEEFSIRWLLSTRVRYKPHLSKVRYVFVQDASKISYEAVTALLKSIEESRFHTKYLFLTNELALVPQTIVSRAITIPFQYLPLQSLVEIATDLEIPKEFLGGSLNPWACNQSFLLEVFSVVAEALEDSIQWLELENKIRNNYSKKMNEYGIRDYKELLDIVSSVFLFQISQRDMAQKIPLLNLIFEFKEELHKRAAGLENFYFSRLCFQIQNLLFKL